MTASSKPAPTLIAPTRSSSSRAALLRTLDEAVPVDPTPYTGAHPNVYFQTPTGNIGCYIFIEDSNRVDCTISNYDFPQPGPDCPLGAVIQIDESSLPSYAGCATAPLSSDSQRVLPYGRSIQNGDLECASAFNGLTCANVNVGSGFFLSRKKFVPVQ